VASTASPAGPPNPSPKLRFSAAEIAALLARGDASLATGDVASARLFYEFAANSGDARAAVRLGETFDPLFLDQPLLRRVPGDLGKAALWYRHARNLGVTEVERRLKTLETKQGG
jgi:TPR repeat protein